MDKYYSHVNEDLLKFIPRNAAVILEIGCGAGTLGQAYKRQNPFCRYIGVECNREVAEQAREVLDEVFCVDVETAHASDFLSDDEKIDCLVFGDVIEHLRDPWRVLKELKSCLSDTGQVLASIPNVQNWWLLRNLLAGQWPYSDRGLLDRSHLRFFTLSSILDLFKQSGIIVTEVISRTNIDPDDEKTLDILLPVVSKFSGADDNTNRIHLSTYQYIVRASLRPPQHKFSLQALLGETLVCSRVRITEPHAFCRTVPRVRVAESKGPIQLLPDSAGENKVFIWQRLSPPSFQTQEELLRRGYLIIYEIDDDPQRWRESYERSDYLAFRSCHAVQVSTEALAAAVRQYNPHVMVFPNQVAELPPPRVYGEGPLELFFGALNREQDWPEIMPFLNDCLRETEHHVTVVHDRLFFDALATKNKEFVPLCPYEQYQQLLSQADIAVLPLTDTHFNRMKSDLKFLECAANGVVALASPVVYAQTIQDGSTGLIYRSPQEFGEKLARLLQDAPWRRELAGKAYEWVKENRLLCRHYEKRLAWYESLREQYDLLTEEIYQRMKRQRP